MWYLIPPLIIVLIILYFYIKFLLLVWKFRNIPGTSQFLPPVIAKHFTFLPFYHPITDSTQLLGPEHVKKLSQKFNSRICRFILFRAPLIFVTDPEVGKMIATKGSKFMNKYERSGINLYIEEQYGASVFSTTDDDVWRHHRSALAPAFTPDAVSVVATITKQYVEEQLFPHIDKQPSTRDVVEDMSHLTMDIIGTAGFAYNFDSFNKKNELSEALEVGFKSANYYNLIPQYFRKNLLASPFKYIGESVITFKNAIGNIIETRKNDDSDQHTDLLQILLKNHEDVPIMTKSQLVSNCMVLLVAGHETTARTLAFALYLLAKNPNVQKYAQEQIDKKIGKNDITIEHLENGDLEYIEAIFKETLRLYPTAYGILRHNSSEIMLHQHKMPKGSLFFYQWMNNQQDEKYWENPKEFRPDRFLPDGEYFTSEKLGSLRQYLYSPFGIGNRACIGKRFAEIEGVITLAMLLQRYNITLKDSKWEMEISIAVTMRPKASPPIVFEKR